MKSFLRTLCAAAAILAWGTVGFAGPIEVVYSFPSPLPFPRFDLDFDTSTGTFWGIENSTKKPNIMNFDRSGTLIQGFIGEDDFNSTGIAVDPLGGRIFYWQDLLRNLHEARYPDGAFIGTTQFPFGYQATANYIDYDPVLNRVVIAKDRFVSIPPLPEIRPGFDFITPGSIDFSVDLDFLAIGNLAGIRGFELTQDSYWILGPHSLYDKIVQIDRTTGHLVDEFILPDSNGKPAIYTGLTLDPSTGLFYSNYSDEGIRALKTAPVPEPSSLALFALSLGTLGFWRPCFVQWPMNRVGQRVQFCLLPSRATSRTGQRSARARFRKRMAWKGNQGARFSWCVGADLDVGVPPGKRSLPDSRSGPEIHRPV